MFFARLPVACVLATAVILAGCGDNKGASSKDSSNGSTGVDFQQAKDDLMRIGIAFHNCNDALARGPKDAQELAPYLENDTRIVNQLKPGGKYIFHWGLSIRTMTQGTSNTILAYLKDPVSPGKYLVVMGDGAPRTLDEADFKQKLKAQGK
jgi:hypothetical protein